MRAQYDPTRRPASRDTEASRDGISVQEPWSQRTPTSREASPELSGIPSAFSRSLRTMTTRSPALVISFVCLLVGCASVSKRKEQLNNYTVPAKKNVTAKQIDKRFIIEFAPRIN